MRGVPEQRLLFVRLLLEVALAKGSPLRPDGSGRCSGLICTELDIGRVELAQLEAMIRAQKGLPAFAGR